MYGAFAIGAIACYLAGSVMLARRLTGGPETISHSKHPALILALIAAALHGVTLHHGIFTQAGLNLGFFNMGSLTGWLISLLVALSAFRRPLENLGIAVMPLAALALVVQLLLGDSGNPLAIPTSIKIHIILSLLAYALLALAFIQALILAIQNRQLHNRHPEGIIRALPPLETMETLLFQLIYTGFTLLTLALVTGFLFLEDIFAQHLVHKTVLSSASWVLFATLLWGRWRFGWRGRTAIRWTLSGFIVLMVAYFGSKMVLELILGR